MPGTPALPPGRPIVLPGRGTTFVRQVAGPPGAATVLLLHGWTVTADLNWFACYEELGRRFNVVAMDHRGHGRGISSRRPFRLEDCADDAADLAAELGLGAVIPVGYSMGGPVAQLLWLRHRTRVAGMVLSATGRSLSGTSGSDRMYFRSLLGLSVASRIAPPAVRRHLAGAFARRRMQGSDLAGWGTEELERNNPSAVLQAGWAIGQFRSHDWIGGIDVPTAVVITTGDQVVSPARQRRLAEAIPGARVFEADGDHGSCVTDPARYLPALVDACSYVAERAGFAVPAGAADA
ncbi:MAG: alpha/beta fold hydrolase [Acidimicrobiales bacterium]